MSPSQLNTSPVARSPAKEREEMLVSPLLPAPAAAPEQHRVTVEFDPDVIAIGDLQLEWYTT